MMCAEIQLTLLPFTENNVFMQIKQEHRVGAKAVMVKHMISNFMIQYQIRRSQVSIKKATLPILVCLSQTLLTLASPT